MRRALLTAAKAVPITYSYAAGDKWPSGASMTPPARKARVMAVPDNTVTVGTPPAGVTMSKQVIGSWTIIAALNETDTSPSLPISDTSSPYAWVTLTGATVLPTITNATDRGLHGSFTEAATGVLVDIFSVIANSEISPLAAPSGETYRAASSGGVEFLAYRTFVASAAAGGSFGGWPTVPDEIASSSRRLTFVMT